MRNAALALVMLSLAAAACSSAPAPEATASSDDSLSIVHLDWRSFPPPPNPYPRPAATFVTTTSATCPNLTVDGGTLFGRTGNDWMIGWGAGSEWPYFQGLWAYTRTENNPHLSISMMFGWTSFCVYAWQPNGLLATYDMPVPTEHYVDLVNALGATDVESANEPAWPGKCHALPYQAPCPNAPCTCEPDRM